METAVTRSAVDLEGFAPEAMQEIVHGGTFEHYVLGRSPYYFSGRQWATKSFAVNTGFYSFATRVLGTFPPHRVSIGYQRQLSSPSWMNGFDIRRGQLQFYAEGVEANYRSAENSEWVILGLEREALQTAAEEHLGCELALPRTGSLNLDVPGPLLGELDRLIQRSLRIGVDSLAMITPITCATAELLANQNPDHLRRSLPRWNKRCEEMKAAETYLQSRLAVQFDGQAFATAMGQSERSLQVMFKQAYGMGPARWARCLALHAARKELRRSNTEVCTVRNVAEAFGFQHMGRFSHYYKELFGQSPSVTLGRK